MADQSTIKIEFEKMNRPSPFVLLLNLLNVVLGHCDSTPAFIPIRFYTSRHRVCWYEGEGGLQEVKQPSQRTTAQVM